MEEEFYQTPYYWFLGVEDEELRNKLLFNLSSHCLEHNLTIKVNSFNEALTKAFKWSNTIEGHGFWRNIRNKDEESLFITLKVKKFQKIGELSIYNYINSIEDRSIVNFLIGYLNTTFKNIIVNSLGEAIICGCSNLSENETCKILKIHNTYAISEKTIVPDITYIEEKIDLKYDNTLIPW